jgi:thymidylate synthase
MISVISESTSATRKADENCKKIIRDILDHGSTDINPRPKYADGTPAHTISINGVLQTYDITKGEFPLISLRSIAVKKAIGEILWIYQDQSNDLNVLRDKYGVTWWDEWDIGDRTIGQCYGKTVKDHNLINKLLNEIKVNPDGRRHILSLWQDEDFKQPHGLKPCACFSKYDVRHEKDGDYLDAFMFLRSSDYLTAGAINQVQYIALMLMICRDTGLKPGVFRNYIDNCQIYDRHIDNAKIMLERDSVDANPILVLNPTKKDFYSFTLEDFKIIDYPREEINAKNQQLHFELGI